MAFLKKINSNVVMILTSVFSVCTNEKTGDVQTQWFIRSDMHPAEAHETHADKALCFNCPLREKVCYTNQYTGQCLAHMYRRMKGNNPYPEIQSVKELKSLLALKPLRLGGHGDPVLLDLESTALLVKYAKNRHTGFTHQWSWCDEGYSRFCMASCETSEQRQQAKAKGYRTARVISCLEEIEEGERLCENQRCGKTCRECGLCNGRLKSAKKYQCDIVFLKHGTGKAHFDAVREAVRNG